MIQSILSWTAAMAIAPFFAGVILKVKAFFGGKKGPPLFIHYYTLAKLFKKGSVYSHSTTFVFRMGPIVSLASAMTALFFVPIAGIAPLVSFNGDAIIVLYILGMGRFFTIAAALDTASPFEGMGAAREAYFPIICEASFLMVIILFYKLTHDLSLSAWFGSGKSHLLWKMAGAPLIFIIISLFIILLAENARVPVDDPATHLELTMIHEVMVLDHSGPDFALIELGAYIKLFFYSSLIARLLIPIGSGQAILDGILFITSIFVIYIAVGVMESVVARYRMDRVPKFVLTSFALAFFATILTLEFAG